MSAPQTKKRNQIKLARLEIVSQLYKRGKSYRQISAEVMRRLGLNSYSLETVKRDVYTLMEEWRENRIDDTDQLVTLELKRIDEAVAELWDQWELSKEDHEKQTTTERASKDGSIKGDKRSQIETKTSSVRGLGNPAYIAEIRQQLQERRKLLGLYAPEKKEVSGELSFASLLMESGMLDDAEQQLSQSQ